jgi:hypothetical protein
MMSNQQLPKISLAEPYGVLSAALVIICHFSDTLLYAVNRGLTELYGDHWQRKLQNDGLLPNDFNSRDPQAVLKELARNGSSQFRLPLNTQISREDLLFFYNGLDDLLGERNAWVHRQLSESIDELQDLAATSTNLLKVCKKEFNYSDWILELLKTMKSPEEISVEVKAEVNVVSTKVNEGEESKLEQVQRVKLSIGDAVTARFLTHSYVVGENGDVLDRVTGVRLSQFNSDYQKSLKETLMDLKLGSRLRLTSEGQLCSFFEDHWGYLAEISATEWFPNHLK